VRVGVHKMKFNAETVGGKDGVSVIMAETRVQPRVAVHVHTACVRA